MILRTLLTAAAAVACFGTAVAEEAWTRLMYNDGSHDDVIMLDYKRGTIWYKLKPNDLNVTKVGPSKIQSFYFYVPKSYKEAYGLYNARNYAEAKKKFAAIERQWKKIDTAPNNFASLAGFYKLECSRRMMDLDALTNEQAAFRKEGLTRENQIQQLEVNKFWEAVRLKDWSRLDRLAKDWTKKKVTGSQRAQIAYCHGLALENLAKENPRLLTSALNAYNMAMTADFSASTELVVAAASNSLRIYANDPEIKLAMKLWGTDDEDANGGGHQRLLEANKLVKLYKLAGLDKVTPLKAEFRAFEKYEDKSEDITPPAAQPKKEEKKDK